LTLAALKTGIIDPTNAQKVKALDYLLVNILF